MLPKLKFLVPVVLVVLMVYRCSTVQETLPSSQIRVMINPPFENKNVAVTGISKTIKATENQTVAFDNGTKIVVKANSFVDANGKPVSSDVELKFREFYKASDIIASGISMQYDSAGVTYDFQSAGMFEINATSGNQQVFLASNANVDVQMASFTEGNDYGFYYLDTATNNWAFMGTANAQTNTEREELLLKIAKELEETLPPVTPQPYDPSVYTFDLDINYNIFPELRELGGIVWQYAGTTADKDPKNFAGIDRIKWDGIQLKPTSQSGIYSLALTARDNTKFNTYVKPVLRGKSLADARKNFEARMCSYNQLVENKKLEQQRLQQQAALNRAFSVNKMGVYNWDRKMPVEQRVCVDASFDFGKKINLKDNPVTVYLITGSQRTVVYYTPDVYNQFAFYPTQENRILAILPGDEIAVFTADDFKKLNTKNLVGTRNTKFEFKLKPLKQKANCLDDLDKIIASI